MRRPFIAPLTCCTLLALAAQLRADPPSLSYLFPAGGQRGSTVAVRAGGLYLHGRCNLELSGPGLSADREWKGATARWLEGPLLPLPESQQAEDYPREVAGTVRVASDAPLGFRPVRVWTSQGAASGFGFVVGDLPEVVERELPGDPVAESVTLPVTINGRIFPREDVDVWAFSARRGQTVTAALLAGRFGSPLEAQLEILDTAGRQLAEGEPRPARADALVRFTAPADGTYQVRVRDARSLGGPAYVYRLTLTAEPFVDRTYPLGGRRGETVAFELAGASVPDRPVTIMLPKDAPAGYEHRFDIGGKASNPVQLDLDDLPEFREAGTPTTIDLPAILNGRIAEPGRTEVWAVALKKNEPYAIELRAHRLGSPLTGVLTLTDPAGKEVARADATADNAIDPVLRFRPPADGVYKIAVADRFSSRGGRAFAYRLRATAAGEPDFRLTFAADTLNVPRGKQSKFRLNVERLGGYNGPIALSWDGLPEGVSVTPGTVPAGQASVDVMVSALPPARIGVVPVTVRGTVGKLVRTATAPALKGLPARDNILLAVAYPTPFRIESDYVMKWASRGTVYQRHYRVERGGFDGPIEIRLADRQARHLQGVTGPVLTLPPGTSEFDYPIQLPPWMETGRTCRVCVMATATVRDGDGSEHDVSFSSTEQNHQIIVVVEPGRLGLEADRTSARVVPGGSVALGLKVARGKGLTGPVKLELLMPDHWHGLAAEPVTVAAGQNVGTLTVRFAADAHGPFTAPAVVRATLIEDGKPVVAEVPVEFVDR
jgi:hypothetical protein